jgi:hypothetical protein
MMKQLLSPSAAMTEGTTNSSGALIKFVDHYAVQTNVSAISVTTGISVKLQGSTDNSNWVDITGTTISLTATGSVMSNVANAGYKYVRAQFVLGSSDTLTAESIITGKERRV